jgi:enolase
MKISSIKAKQIVDSKGSPTLETTVTLEDGSTGIAAVPSGASTGKYEAIELRDDDGNVRTAIEKVETDIANAVTDIDIADQQNLDELMINLDGTENKSNLGANSILSVSMAFCRACAKSENLQLYEYLQQLTGTKELENPKLNILMMEGGKHGDWNTDIQEYMIIPEGDVTQSLNTAKKIFEELSKLLDSKGYEQKLGMEGGLTPSQIKSNTEPLDLIVQAGEKAGFIPGEDFSLALDFAASEFISKDKVELKSEDKTLGIPQWIEIILSMLREYPIRYIEDYLGEDDWQNWAELKEKVGDEVQLVGDDLTVTNTKRIQKAIDEKAINSTIIKPNQIGSVSETLQAIELSENNGVKTIISHRGGETEDSFIADLVTGTRSTQTKFGAFTQKERMAKYNRLLEIY